MRLRASLLSLLLPAVLAQKVTISNGEIQGGGCPSSAANFYHSIPFARPPVGDLRFAAPQPYVQRYNGTLNGTRSAPTCIQFNEQFGEPEPWSEDCLFLNVWTPRNASGCSKLPVKVWVYGGSNLAGGISNALYDGCNSAEDAIVVAINYRLGPLGFLGLEKAGLSGNFAVQDLLLGLRWVQENIEAFGGDPVSWPWSDAMRGADQRQRKVLLFGQSAGAALSYTISTLPEAPSLISAVAAESGGGRGAATYAEAQPYFETFAKNLGCPLDSLTCLRSKSASDLIAAMPSESAKAVTLAYSKGFATTIDGAVILADPAKVGTRVPAIFGSTAADGSMFTLSAYQNNFPPTEANYTYFVASNFGPYASVVERYYPISRFANISSPSLAPYFAMTAIWTHASYICSAYRGLKKAEENGISAYAYVWDIAPSCPWSRGLDARIMKLMGATHTSEIPYVFRNTEHLPRPNGTCAFSAGEKEVGDQIASAWTAMAKEQAPDSPALPGSWPAFRSNQTEGMMFGSDGAAAGKIDYSFCELWDRITAALASDGNMTATPH